MLVGIERLTRCGIDGRRGENGAAVSARVHTALRASAFGESISTKKKAGDLLHSGWHVDRVNHSDIYSDHGENTNMGESHFSRLRNMVGGQHHHVSPQYLHQYANHAAWLEDYRRTDNGTLARIVVSNAVGSLVSGD